jgi:hypothetical protein
MEHEVRHKFMSELMVGVCTQTPTINSHNNLLTLRVRKLCVH